MSDTPTLTAQPLAFWTGLQFLPPGSTGLSLEGVPWEDLLLPCWKAHPPGFFPLSLPCKVSRDLDYNACLSKGKRVDMYQSITP